MRVIACFMIAVAGLIASDALLHLGHTEPPQVAAPIQEVATR